MNLLGLLLGIALFARQYGVSCQKCHSVVPRLNAFGQHFAAFGNRIPGARAVSVGDPIAFKVNLVASSARQGDGPDGQGLPKAIVDEIEVLTGGTVGTRGSYFAEQYVVDGGSAGRLREAWGGLRLNPWDAKVPVQAQAGSMTLPLPVDPETFRETAAHYAVFDQTVGENPFTFFDARSGAKLTVGNTLRGTSAQLFAGNGTMLSIAHAMQPISLSLYRYGGAGFTRAGWGISFERGRWESDSVLQSGYDASSDTRSNGGFMQVRYAVSPRFFALARYEGTSDTSGSFDRHAVALVGYRLARNARVTLEDLVRTSPATSHQVTSQVMVGF